MISPVDGIFAHKIILKGLYKYCMKQGATAKYKLALFEIQCTYALIFFANRRCSLNALFARRTLKICLAMLRVEDVVPGKKWFPGGVVFSFDGLLIVSHHHLINSPAFCCIGIYRPFCLHNSNFISAVLLFDKIRCRI